jgi:hypothetical protein
MLKTKYVLSTFIVITILLGIAGITAWNARAQDSTLIFEQAEQGTLEPGQSNRWTFEAHRDAIIQVTISRLSGNLIPQISLLDQDDKLLAQIDGTQNAGATLTFRIPHFGNYTLEIQSLEETSGGYEALLHLVEEGLQSFEQGQISYGELVSQTISDSTPYHFWTFTGRTGQVIDLKMTATSGDLQPVLALISPGGDVIARASGDEENQSANLLAFRLPGDGIYRIYSKRAGDNLGEDGETSGSYTLELTLRNGGEATASRYTLGEEVMGQITQDSPLLRYDIPRSGLFAVYIEFENPRCLVDFTILNRGITLLSHVTSASPFQQILAIPNVPDPIIEISTANCFPESQTVFSLKPVNIDPATQFLPDHQTMRSQGSSDLEQWYFEGKQGDLVTLLAQKNTFHTNTLLRVVGPDLVTRYTETFYQQSQVTLLLDQDGIYIVQISSHETAYQLSRTLVGTNNLPFALQTPLWEEPLDIEQAGVWHIAPENLPTNVVLTLESPQQEQLIAAQPSYFHPPQIQTVQIEHPGRYWVKAYARSAAPAPIQASPAISATQRFGSELPINGEIKGNLPDADTADHWSIPISQGERLNLTLEVLNSSAPQPTLTVLSQSGVQIQPTFSSSEAGQIELIGIEAAQDEILTVVAGRYDSEDGRLDYRLTAESLNTPSTQIPPPVNLASESPQGFATQTITPTPLDTLAYAIQPSLLATAQRASLPSQFRVEIAPSQLQQAWTMNIVRGQLVSITATSLDDQPPPGLTLLDANYTILIEHWERNNSLNQLLYRTVEANTYYLVATSTPDGGRFLLDIQTLPRLDEQVPTVIDQTPLAINEPYVADFTNNGEIDAYVFWVNGGTRLRIGALHQIGDLVPQITLIDPNGILLAQGDYNPETERAEIAEVRLPQSGIYTLHVTASQPDNEADYSRYRLILSLISGQEAGYGYLADHAIGTLGVGSPENIWLFSAQSGESLSIQVEPLSPNGPTPITLTLTDSLGNAFYQKSTQLSVNSLSIHDLMLPRTGFYQVQVTGGDSAVGSYRIRLGRNQDYLIQPDHTITHADTVSGVLAPSNLLDRWMLAGSAGDIISVALHSVRGDPTLMGFQIEKPNGDIIAVGADRGNGAGARLENILLPETGVYYILAGATDATFTGQTVYELSIERQQRTHLSSTGSLLTLNNSTYTSTLYADDPTHIWLFDIPEPTILTITLTGDGVLAPTFDLFSSHSPLVDGQLQPLLSRTGTNSDAARLASFPITEAGAYVLAVSGVEGSTGTYHLSLTTEPAVIPPRRVLKDGLNYEGNLANVEDEIWQIEGKKGDIISLTLTVPRRSGLIPQVRIRDEAGKTLLTENRFNANTLEIRDFHLPSDGSFILQILPTLGSSSQQAIYTISFEQTKNPFVPFTKALAYGESGIGEFNDDSLSDIWTFEGFAGDVAHLAVVHTSGELDTTLTLTSPSGEVITTADDVSSSLAPEALVILPETGQYTLEVATFGGLPPLGERNNYRLDLKLEYRPASIQPPSDRFLTYGDQIVETLDPISVSDSEFTSWYFVGKAQDVIDISLQFPPDDSPLRLFLTDGAGQAYQQGERNRDRATIQNFALPSDGIYTILIQRSLDSLSTSYYPYTLSLNLRSGVSSSPSSPFLVKGTVQGASFQVDQPTHTWFYNGRAGETINLSLLALTGEHSPSLFVQAPDNRILLNLPGNTTTKTQNVPLVLPVDGLYQIILVNDRLDPFLNYRLAINSDTAPPLAGRLLPNITDYGNLSATATEGVWLVEGQAASSLYARAQVTAGNLVIALRLETLEGVILANSQAEPSSGQIILDPVILPADGDYRLIVSKVGGQLSNQAGSYQIQISQDSTTPAALFAQPLPPEISLAGFVEAGRTAYYSFFAEANTPLMLDVKTAGSAEAPILSLSDNQGRDLTRYLSGIPTAGLPQTGYYLVRLDNPHPTTFTITYQPRPLTSVSDAVPVRRLTNLQGNLTAAAPVDLWAIEAQTGEVLSIRTSDFSRLTRSDLLLFDSAGNPITGTIEAEGETENEMRVLIPQSDTYLLRVGTWLGQVSEGGYQYALRIEPTPDSPRLGGEIVPWQKSIWGMLTAETPANDWQFTVEPALTYTIQIEGIPNTIPLSLTLIGDPQNPPLDLKPYVTTAREQLSINDLVLPEQGRYTLRIGLEQPDPDQNIIYALTIEAQSPPPQDILTKDQQLSFGWQEALNLGIPERVAFSSSVPIHQWNLIGHGTGTYQTVIKPTGGSWQARAYILDNFHNLIAAGEIQPDGSTILTSYLLQDVRYQLFVKGDGIIGNYDILFDIRDNVTTPAFLVAGQTVTGRLSSMDTTDEWLWENDGDDVLALRLVRTDGDAEMLVHIYAPGNLFLQEFEMDESGAITADAIALPIEGRYIIQVTRSDDLTSSRRGVYELQVGLANP